MTNLNGTVMTPPRAPVSAACSGALSLPASPSGPTDITGCSVSLTPGNWLVTGVFDFSHSGAGDNGVIALGYLATTGGAATVSNSSSLATFALLAGGRGPVAQTWAVAVTATTTAKLQGQKASGSGASTAGQTHTIITAIPV